VIPTVTKAGVLSTVKDKFILLNNSRDIITSGNAVASVFKIELLVGNSISP
jgi:hypothetical protein